MTEGGRIEGEENVFEGGRARALWEARRSVEEGE